MSRLATEAEKAALDAVRYGLGLVDQNGKHVPIEQVRLEGKRTAATVTGVVSLREWLARD